MLRHVASLVFEPLAASYSFRWQGEFGPQTRGPQAFSQSHALPPPSTIAGVLAGQALQARGQSLCQGQGGVYGDTLRGLRLLLGCAEGGPVALRGPYLYRATDEGWLLCSATTEGLFCVARTGRGLRLCLLRNDVPASLQAVGIALDNLSKTVISGLIYTAVYLDVRATLRRAAEKLCLGGAVKREGLLVELYAGEGCGASKSGVKELDGSTVVLGAETRPFRIHVDTHAPGLELAENAARERGDCMPFYVATPIILEDGIPQANRYRGDELAEAVFESVGLRPCTINKAGPVALGRLRLTAVGLGFSLCRGKRRPYQAAVMHGAIIYAMSSRDPLSLYTEGLGAYRELGWGTVIPLTPEDVKNLIEALKEKEKRKKRCRPPSPQEATCADSSLCSR